MVNKWDARKAYHLSSKDGMSNWKLDTGNVFDPAVAFIRYKDGTMNNWFKIECPFVYLEDGHVATFVFSAINIAIWEDKGDDQNGHKVIVVLFDGAVLDRDMQTLIIE